MLSDGSPVLNVGSQPWRDMNDVVMGGQSQGTLVIQDGLAVFKGVLR